MRKLHWRNWPLAFKLTLVIGLLVTTSVTSITLVRIRDERQVFRTELMEQAKLILDSLTVAMADALYRVDIEELSENAQALSKTPMVGSVRFYDEDGRVLADSEAKKFVQSLKVDPFGQQIITSLTTVFEWQAEQLVAGQVITIGRNPLGAVSVGLTLAPLKTKIATERNQGIAVALAMIVVGIVLSLLFSRSITKPLRNLVSAAQQIAEGDLRGAVEERLSPEIHPSHIPPGGVAKKVFQGKNEITLLSYSFQQMTAYIQHVAEVADTISDGNLHVKVQPQSEHDRLGQAFLNMSVYLNEMADTATAVTEGDLTQRVHVRSAEDTFGQVIHAMTDGLQTLIEHIRTSAEQLVVIKTDMAHLTQNDLQVAQHVKMSVDTLIATITEIGTSVDEVAKRMETLSSAVEETSASVAQMTPSIGHITSNTAELNRQADTTRAFLTETMQALEQVVDRTESSQQLSQATMQDALEGQKSMTQVTTSMDVLQTTMTTAMEAMTDFVQRSQEIDTMLEVIREIADQTSLLALNASILSAQAGDQGRGFSVVAEEMKSLSTDVAMSAKEIAAVVQSLQHDTERVVHTVQAGVQNVEQGTERTQQAQDALKKILTSAQGSSVVVTEIAEALHALMTNGQQVAKSIEHVKAMTDEIHTATNEQKISTVQINHAISQMNDLASQIQHAAFYQSTGLQQVLETTDEITALIGQNVDSSQQMTQATQRLTAQAEQLLQSVNRFTLSR